MEKIWLNWKIREYEERVTLYTYVCSYLLLKERIQELYMFRNKIYKIIDLLVSYLVNSAKSETFSLIVAYFEISEADDILVCI
jgi:hypothetical protein